MFLHKFAMLNTNLEG